MVTVFCEEVLDLFTADVALVLPINPAECRIWFEHYLPSKRLSLPLNTKLFLSNHDQKACQSRPDHG